MDKDVNNRIYNRIAELRQYESKWKAKYLRNLRLYTYSMNVSLDQIKEGNVLGYWNTINQNGYTSTINENVIQSAIDSLVSMIAAKNARPFMSGVNLSYDEKEAVKQAQQFFDVYIDRQNINKIVTEAFRDACIFGNGFIYVDQKEGISKALPWQVIYRPAEATYGKITRVLYERKWYPTTLLEGSYKTDYVTYSVYFDINTHQKVSLVDNKIIKTEPYNNDRIPFINLQYNNPVYGKDATSVVDLLYGIQMKLDELYQTISEAIRLNPAQTFLVPQGSDVKVTALTNRTGQIMQYKPIEGVSNPVQVSTPNFIADQYLQMVEQLKNDAFEITGVSKLQAQSKKPSGVDSGRALQTLNDITSERFEVQQRAVINAYSDLLRLYIQVADPESMILPEDMSHVNIQWKFLQNILSKTKISVSSLDFLSKDATTRQMQIDSLVQAGYLPKAKAISYLEIPDLDGAYNYSNNLYNAISEVISEAMHNEDYTIPDFIPAEEVKVEAYNTLLALSAVRNENNLIFIERIKKLYEEADNICNKVAQIQQQNDIQNQEQMYQQNLQQQVETTQALAFAQVKGQIDAQASLTNNIGENLNG